MCCGVEEVVSDLAMQLTDQSFPRLVFRPESILPNEAICCLSLGGGGETGAEGGLKSCWLI